MLCIKLALQTVIISMALSMTNIKISLKQQCYRLSAFKSVIPIPLAHKTTGTAKVCGGCHAVQYIYNSHNYTCLCISHLSQSYRAMYGSEMLNIFEYTNEVF